MTPPSLAAALAADASSESSPRGTAVYATELFGQLAVSDASVVRFDDGLLGFPGFTRWILLDGARDGLGWLQSAEHPALAFLLVEPFVVYDEFTLDAPPTVVKALGAERADELAVFAIVTLGTEGATATANLQGPIMMNLRSRLGAQFVTPETGWGLRQPVPAELLCVGQ
jgi:flagellar assembly factor FliW